MCAAANGTNADVDHLGLVRHITEVSNALQQQAKACATFLGTSQSKSAQSGAPHREEAGGPALSLGALPEQDADRKKKGRAQKRLTAAEEDAERATAEPEAQAARESR